ncbi:LuxR C-terminal-related transcriptional regulator [Frisingicoccus sp.]|uniref:helix-turn-helix transcriptional regulator n=1 Tax=Frisingicoccus sp. TaxID=1918627 RepID=UPI002E9AF7C7|nr:helix-turn-helix transcriptional regulator [Frisingicoccus sp.]
MKTTSIRAMFMLGIFTFLFLGSEYLYVDMIAMTAGGNKTVIVQNYALGMSALGFFLYPLFHRFLGVLAQKIGMILMTLISAVCLVLILIHPSYTVTLGTGMLLFLVWGVLGGAVHYLFIRLVENEDCLARMVGISYALGILFQFVNNNLIHSDMVQMMILVFCSLILFGLVLWAEKNTQAQNEDAQKSDAVREDIDSGEKWQKILPGILLALLVALMACIFSTLDNAITMRHVEGMDIGQWPRLFLALSGLIAGILFDIRKRKHMNMLMYYIMMLSVICVVVLKAGGPFILGLVVFYLSSGFFVVFFTTSFMAYARRMDIPELWAGMGRTMNNISAVVLTHCSVALLTSENNVTAIILVLVLFVAISVILIAYTVRISALDEAESEEQKQCITGAATPEEALQIMAERFSLTEREVEVLDKLVNTEESIQEIADALFLSRRTCQRRISSIYEKVGVKSRMGLYQFYIEKILR